MPSISSERDVLIPELLLVADGAWSLYYCAFDWINPAAKVVLVGITPGLRQMYMANREAQRALLSGLSLDRALSSACQAASFGGPMRRNLVAMLDGIGLNAALQISTTESMFGSDANLLHSTSALIYPTFYRDKNYSGGRKLPSGPISALAEHVLPSELRSVPEAIIVPLGKDAHTYIKNACDRGQIEKERCLIGFPHPSGGNGHRKHLYEQNRGRLTESIARWFESKS